MNNDIRLIQMNNYVRPQVIESQSQKWVLNGKKHSFFDYIIDRYNGSPTNAAIIDSYRDLIYGQGLTNKNGNIEDWLIFRKMIQPEEVRKIITDYVVFGEAMIQVIPANNSSKPPTLYHIPVNKMAPNKVNNDNEIEYYWYSENWSKINQPEYKPERINVISNNSKNGEMCFPIKPYRPGKKYYADPEYLGGIGYAELEEEIQNYYLSHVKNGLSFGYIINIPNGSSYTEEEKDEIERKIKQKLSGSSNAGKFVINFNGGNADISVEVIQISEAHNQWEYLTGEARQQLMTSHRVTSPMLFGIKDNTGLGNNADELDTAERQLMKRVIRPKQRYIINALEYIANIYDVNVDLEFKPLTEEINNKLEQGDISVKMKGLHPVHELIALGEDMSEYDLVASYPVDYNNIIQLATTGTAFPNAKSEMDTDDVKVRYRYGGDPNPEREFCREMMRFNKVYRREDIEKMGTKTVNPGFGMHPNPNAPYSIWLYKGGGLLSGAYPNGTCKHFWLEEVYVKKGVNVDVKSPTAEMISRATARSRGLKLPDEVNPKVFVAPHDM